MIFTMQSVDPAMRYRLLTSSIVPRPIAWITTVDASGRVNLAPFSCFNLMGYEPPLAAVGIQSHPDGRFKDTVENVALSRELVINLVAVSHAEPMVKTSIDAPPAFDEADYAGVSLVPSERVAPPRVADAPVSFECSLYQLMRPSPVQTIILAKVIAMHVRDDCVTDAQRGYLDTARLDLLGRMEGPGWYTRCSDRLQMMADPAGF